MLTKLRGKAQLWLTYWAKLAYRLGLRPNFVSALGLSLATSSAAAYVMWHDHWLMPPLAPTLLLLSGLCDALDGALARAYGSVSAFGGFFDSLLDRYADAIVLIGVMLGGLCDVLWGSLALMGSLLTSYARARAEAEGVRMESIGLIERPERILILASSSFIAIARAEALRWAVILLAFLTNLTVLQRAVHFSREVKRRKASRTT